MTDKTRAILGDHEAARRLTDAGVLASWIGIGTMRSGISAMIAAGRGQASTPKDLRIQRKPAWPGTPARRF